MITKRVWYQRIKVKRGALGPSVEKIARQGWFLFGIIPLYVEDVQARGVSTL